MSEHILLKLISGFSAYTLVIFGVDTYSLLYAFIGTMLLLSKREKTTKIKSLLYVVLSTIGGAAVGVAIVEYMELTTKATLFVACMMSGGGLNTLLEAFIGATQNRISQIGGLSGKLDSKTEQETSGDNNG